MAALANIGSTVVWLSVAGWILYAIYPAWPLIDIAIAACLSRAVWVKVREQLQRKDQFLRTSDVSTLSPLAYEDYCAVVLRDAGWRTHTTPLQDQGVDVLANMRGVKAVIQCKMYSHPVGNRAVQEVVAGRLHYGADIAVVVSPAPYTRSARELAASTRVLLLHHDQLPMLERIAKIR
jgi:restriction system protein